MQSIDLCDRLTLELLEEKKLVFEGAVAGVASACDNLAYKAAQSYLTAVDSRFGVAIRLEKKIPVAAGLAGGSTDAAAVLRGLNQLHDNLLDEERLQQMAAVLGSDIPFCLTGGTALATGRGECVEQLAPLPDCAIVLLKPAFGISTAQVYQTYDKSHVQERPQTQAMLAALQQKNLSGVCANLVNVLEPAAFSIYPQLRQYKALLLQNGVQAALMSGSGTTLFGICSTLGQAQKIAARLQEQCPDAQVFAVRTKAQMV